MVDKRNSIRFKIKNRAFSKLSDHSCPYHVALILDMSTEGMAFSYLGKDAICQNLNKLDIMYEDGLCINDVCVKIISDIKIQRKKITTRRCGVQFVNLTPQQQQYIGNFIKAYAAGSA